MIKFSVEDFEVYTLCEFDLIGKVLSSCNRFSYSFETGIYALVGEITGGGWAFTYAIAPVKKKILYQEGITKYSYNNSLLSLKEVQSISHYVGYFPKKTIIDYIRENTVESQVKKSIIINGLPYSTNEIKQLFGITDERFQRNIRNTGFERWRCSSAIGFVNGKRIFCFPWLSEDFLEAHKKIIKKVCITLKEKGCIVLIPVSNYMHIKEIIDAELNIIDTFKKTYT